MHSDIIVTTTDTISGETIHSYRKIITEAIAINDTDFFMDPENVILNARKKLMQNIENRAREMHCDAVLGYSVETTWIRGIDERFTIILLTASGTPAIFDYAGRSSVEKVAGAMVKEKIDTKPSGDTSEILSKYDLSTIDYPLIYSMKTQLIELMDKIISKNLKEDELLITLLPYLSFLYPQRVRARSEKLEQMIPAYLKIFRYEIPEQMLSYLSDEMNQAQGCIEFVSFILQQDVFRYSDIDSLMERCAPQIWGSFLPQLFDKEPPRYEYSREDLDAISRILNRLSPLDDSAWEGEEIPLTERREGLKKVRKWDCRCGAALDGNVSICPRCGRNRYGNFVTDGSTEYLILLKKKIQALYSAVETVLIESH